MASETYRVIDTPCYPCRWKVESVQWPGRNNSFTEFFPDRGDAEREANRRNRPTNQKGECNEG